MASGLKIYVIGSLRNPRVQEIAAALRKQDFHVFDDWHGGGPEADDHWMAYAKARGWSMKTALNGYLAKHIFALDERHLDECDIAVLVMPAGKSGHLELGYAAGKGKRTFVLFDQEPERFDVMYNFCTAVAFTLPELLAEIEDSYA